MLASQAISGGDWAFSSPLQVEDGLSMKDTAGNGKTQAAGPKQVGGTVRWKNSSYRHLMTNV